VQQLTNNESDRMFLKTFNIQFKLEVLIIDITFLLLLNDLDS